MGRQTDGVGGSRVPFKQEASLPNLHAAIAIVLHLLFYSLHSLKTYSTWSLCYSRTHLKTEIIQYHTFLSQIIVLVSLV
jgi:hypothetical protein